MFYKHTQPLVYTKLKQFVYMVVDILWALNFPLSLNKDEYNLEKIKRSISSII